MITAALRFRLCAIAVTGFRSDVPIAMPPAVPDTVCGVPQTAAAQQFFNLRQDIHKLCPA
jgi:hypothetical protein